MNESLNHKRKQFYIGNLLNNIEPIKLCSNPEIKTSNSNFNCIYDIPLKDLLKKTNHYGKPVNYTLGDIFEEVDPSNIVKNRTRDSNNGVIIRCLSFERHWGNYYNKPRDIPFDDKKNKIIWRGTTTGQLNNKGNRFDLVLKWYYQNKDIDVGFSFICQDKHDFKQYVKGKMSITDMLNYKYIISVEGNDKDSGINWKLNSNSVVLMPKPRSTSWLMETTLIPGYHYVLLKDDFSDLLEKYEWCELNQDKCMDIIKHANTFMDQFSDKKKEEQIEIDVIHTYFDILENNIKR